MTNIRQHEYTVPPEHDNIRVQDYLMSVQGYSRRIITRLKQTRGDILLNGEHIRMVDIIHTNDVITVSLREQTHIAQNSELVVPIVYEDDDLIVYNKPINMPVHPSRNHQNDTLANVFCAYMHKKGVNAAFHPINRLDRDTDGLCVVAKNALSASKIQVCKEYTAICCGKVTPLQGKIDAPIIRLDEFYIKRAVREDGQPSVTNYKVTAQNEQYSKVIISLETGRTHQIRVHFSHIGYPLAGDDMYGGNCMDITHHALCCNKVWFNHPITNENICLCINIQEDMSKLTQDRLVKSII